MAAVVRRSSKTDVLVIGQGGSSVFVFRWLNERARVWIMDHTDPDNRQFFGGGIVVEHRYVESFAAALGEDGLIVRGIGR